MELLFFCSRWGYQDMEWGVFLDRVKASGYDGVETDLPASDQECRALLAALGERSLLLVAQHSRTVDPDFHGHLAAYREEMNRAAGARPWCVNAHTGRDFFTPEENLSLLEIAEQISQATGVPVYHETHRGKFSFAAHITAAYLKRIPSLELTLDVSHWMTVAESYLYEQQDMLAVAVSRTRHIHARVGHTQAPQVADPRAPEWREACQRHLAIWDQVYEARRAAGAGALGITVEFGPFPYMPVQPYTQLPAVDLWEVNGYMKDLLQHRYSGR